jgi:hypothetical protein
MDQAARKEEIVNGLLTTGAISATVKNTAAPG